MKKFLITCFVAVNILALGACSDKDDPEPNEEGKTGKFTITVDKVDGSDQIHFSFQAISADISRTAWKINGTERSNEAHITLEKNDFANTRSYVVETTRELSNIIVNLVCANTDEPLKFTYKAEVNGKVVKEETKTVNEADGTFGVQYQY